MTTDKQELLTRDPIGLTQREMLLRLDGRLDDFEPRVRRLEDGQLAASTERKVIFRLLGSVALFMPLVTAVVLRLIGA